MENKDLKIPFVGLKRQYANLREELLAASDVVYSSGQVLDGVYTHRFEAAIATRCHRRYATAVNSCTEGLIFSIMAGVPIDTKVIIPNISFAATVNSVLMAGHNPVICDTDDKALLDLESMDITMAGAGAGAIMYANLFGNIIDYDRFRVLTEFFGKDMFIIEDAAQSFGASYKGQPSGSLGDISVLSFDPTKNLPNYGSGGMVLTDDYELYCNVIELRDNGKSSKHQMAGTNSKMSESDCAQMLVKLTHFDTWQKRRSMIADYYIEHLHPYVDIVMPNEGVEHAWHKFIIRIDSRNRLKHHLEMAGIEVKIHYDTPLSEYLVAWQYGVGTDFRESTAWTKDCLSLPIYPELTDSEVEHIVDTVKRFYV